MSETIFKPFYFEGMQGLKDDVSFLNRLLSEKNKKLSKHLNKIDFRIDTYFFTWIVCMFSNLKIDEEYCHHLIEYILEHKKKGLFTAILFCLEGISDKLFKCKDNMEAKSCFTDLGKIFENTKLIKKLKKTERSYELSSTYKEMNNEECQSVFIILTEDCFDLKKDMKSGHFHLIKSGVNPVFKERFNDENKFKGNTP